ncbi:MAG: hypothetical protein WC517_00445 [Patescibacteria group bacterium]
MPAIRSGENSEKILMDFLRKMFELRLRGTTSRNLSLRRCFQHRRLHLFSPINPKVFYIPFPFSPPSNGGSQTQFALPLMAGTDGFLALTGG